jgi:4'-phosphopantetheinyl transferase
MDRSGIHFNASHSGSLAVYAVTLGAEVGIDVEELRPMTDRSVIAGRFFSAREAEALAALPLQFTDLAFFKCWTCKEAYIKATGQGLSLPLDCFDVAVAPDEPPRLLRAPGGPPESQGWTLRGLDPGVGYLAALAVQTRLGTLHLYDWKCDLERT